jgi:hypothetical protein
MSEVDDLIEAILAAIPEGRNQELMIYHLDYDGLWSAEACNPVVHVCLGESTGEYTGHGKTMIKALQALLADIKSRT